MVMKKETRLECLGRVEETYLELSIRFVVMEGLNSVGSKFLRRLDVKLLRNMVYAENTRRMVAPKRCNNGAW